MTEEQWRQFKGALNNMKCNNICIIGIEGEEMETGVKNLFEKKWQKTSLTWWGRVIQVQEAQEFQSRYTHRCPHQDTTQLKWQNLKTENLKSSERETASYLQRSSDKVISWFLNRNSTGETWLSWNIPSNEKQGPATKTTLSRKALV